jgi:hypothetical protein
MNPNDSNVVVVASSRNNRVSCHTSVAEYISAECRRSRFCIVSCCCCCCVPSISSGCKYLSSMIIKWLSSTTSPQDGRHCPVILRENLQETGGGVKDSIYLWNCFGRTFCCRQSSDSFGKAICMYVGGSLWMASSFIQDCIPRCGGN